MPELPEVDAAARQLDAAIRGRVLRAVSLLHPAIRRVDEARLSSLVGQRVVKAARVAKWQEVTFERGDVLVVHFRMTGDWAVSATSAGPPHARAHFAFSGRCHVWLVDPRALARLGVRLAGEADTSRAGPDAMDPALDATQLRARFRGRRAAIKQVLLDQQVLAGVGNIYASEALWHARIHPAAPAGQLSAARVARLLTGIRWAMDLAFAEQGRHQYGTATARFRVYDREGLPCERCGSAIARTVQGQRSTYWCRRCQRA